MTEQEAGSSAEVDLRDADQQWEGLEAGLRSRAMRAVYEEQQKLVVDLGRSIMEKQTEIAIAVAKMKAAADLKRDVEKQSIVEDELIPRRKELQELQARIKSERELLDAYEQLGKGII